MINKSRLSSDLAQAVLFIELTSKHRLVRVFLPDRLSRQLLQTIGNGENQLDFPYCYRPERTTPGENTHFYE